jgi:hypothetical protein
MADAASMKPKFVPDFQLLPRDDSGGYDYQPRTAQWDDGAEKVGEKAHLSVSGGKEESVRGTEQDSTSRARDRNSGEAGSVGARTRRDAKN